MSAMPQASRRPRKTVEDFMALPDEVRAELIDGELYVTPSPEVRHQDLVVTLAYRLKGFLEANPIGSVYVAPLDVHLPTGDIVQPDVLFVASAHRALLRRWVHGAPDLVVEVLSPARPERDRFVKRVVYERGGVSEYWLVDGEERSVEILRLAEDGYAPWDYLTGDGTLRSPTLEGFELPLPDLFGA